MGVKNIGMVKSHLADITAHKFHQLNAPYLPSMFYFAWRMKNAKKPEAWTEASLGFKETSTARIVERESPTQKDPTHTVVAYDKESSVSSQTLGDSLFFKDWRAQFRVRGDSLRCDGHSPCGVSQK